MLLKKIRSAKIPNLLTPANKRPGLIFRPLVQMSFSGIQGVALLISATVALWLTALF